MTDPNNDAPAGPGAEPPPEGASRSDAAPEQAPAGDADAVITKTPRPGLNRRAALGALGLGVVGGVAAGAGVSAWGNRRDVPGTPAVESGTLAPATTTPTSPTTGTSTGTGTSSAAVTTTPTTARPVPPPPTGAAVTPGFTRQDWIASRGEAYYIAHRGSGDVYPEHSLPAYQAAIAAGARCMEISVGMTSDGRLICMHDQTYDRTTTATGNVADQPSTILRSVSLTSPQLGPAWAEPPLPRVPLLEEALRVVGGRSVLCLEAKIDAAYPSMMALAESLGLTESLIVKAFHTSSRIKQAKAAGYPVFGYLGNPDGVTPENIAALAAKLDPTTDYFVVPAYDAAGDSGYLSDESIRACIATGIPVWVFPVHRRADAAHFLALGVTGIITSSFGYVSGSAPIAVSDSWQYQAITPGEMTRDPSSAAWAPTWTSPDELALGIQGNQHFVTLGQFGPLAQAADTYEIDFEAAFTTLPADPSGGLTVAFAHVDDAYYETGRGRGSGYRAAMGTDGQLSLFKHLDGQATESQLGDNLATVAPTIGQWMQFHVQVSPTQLSWSRVDGGAQRTLTVGDATVRGGYLHIGRTGTDGVVAFRKFSVA